MLGKKSTDTKINTLIGAGAELNGDFTLDGSARIDGKIGGNVTVTGSLILGAGSVVTGEVQAASVLIGGEVTGNITAPEKAELTASAKVLGDIATKVIVIDEHAIFQGKIDMNQTVPDKKGKAKAAKATRAGRKSAKAAIAEALKEVEEEEKRENQENTAAPEQTQNTAAEETAKYKKKTLGIICQRLFSPYVRIPVHNRHCHNSENDSLC